MNLSSLSTQKIEVTLSEISVGDIIFIHPTDNATPYLVLDIGHPFILVENMKSHFASLYHPVKPIYKQLISKE